MISTLLRELLPTKLATRCPEPSMAMDDCDQAASFAASGNLHGVMAPTHLFHSSHVSDIIRPGERAIDLACGPGLQLLQVASFHPEVEFLGVDISEPMLNIAAERIRGFGAHNVDLLQADITRLDQVKDHSIDTVFSSMSLHHLPDIELLRSSFQEIRRILRPNGTVYLADFARLKSARSMRTFAHAHAERQSEQFTRDYLNSLHAAWSVAEIRLAMQPIAPVAQLYNTFGIRLMMAIKSPPRLPFDANLKARIREIRNQFDDEQERDLQNLIRFFRWGGLSTPYLDAKRRR